MVLILKIWQTKYGKKFLSLPKNETFCKGDTIEISSKTNPFSGDKIYVKVLENISNKQLFVCIPKNSSFVAGEYVEVIKA